MVTKKVSDRWTSPGLIATVGTQVDKVIPTYDMRSSKTNGIEEMSGQVRYD